MQDIINKWKFTILQLCFIILTAAELTTHLFYGVVWVTHALLVSVDKVT